MVSETLREVTAGLDDGKYRIVSTLKEGRLYLAEKAGKRFILKTAEGARGLERLKREYELSIGLSHPSLAFVFTYEDSSPVGPCIVQEFVDGEPLDEWLSCRPAEQERRRVFSELLSVMAYLHRKGIIHNDLKPDNILITRSGGSLKLIDFGFADDDVHTEKAIGGTRAYASPELLSGSRVDARSDVYSIGLILRLFFPGRYGNIARRCLRRDPGKRFDSAGVLEKKWELRNMPVWAAAAVAVIVAIGCLTYNYIVTNQELSALRETESSRAEALSKAKEEVNAWYDTEVPAFLDDLSKSRTNEEANSVWIRFVGRTSIINTDLPNRTPEEVRAALREYIFHRYNTTFPALQDSLTKKLLQLSL